MRKLVSYFIKYPVSVNTLLLVIVLGGFASYSKLTASFFPLIESRIINVNLVYPGASPEEIEEGVVDLIEENLEGVTGIERTTSSSKENSAVVVVEIEKGYDTNSALEDVQNAVNSINSFPTGLEKPVVFLRENSNFTISFALSSEEMDLKILKAYARKIEQDLLDAEGISKVNLGGFPAEEIEIAFNDEALRNYNLTIEEASNSIRSKNLDITGGTVRGLDEELLIRSRNKGYYSRDIENIVLRSTEEGAIVRLKDVAEVKDKWAEDPNSITVDGDRAVEITVNSTDDEDLLANAEYVREYFKVFNTKGYNIKATLIRDRSETLQERKDLLIENGGIGMFLVLLLLSLFLNIRLAFWVAVGIPISFLGMFILASYYGVTVNVISLFGMIVVIGILVDDGIVISENVYSHHEKGKKALRAAIDGTMEVLPAVFSAVITTMIAFSFFFMVDGRAGDFFSELSFVVIATLAVSLIEALIILPSHLAHSKAMKKSAKKSLLEKGTDKMMHWMRDMTYAPALRFCLKHRFFTIAFAVSLFIITIGAIKGDLVKFTFFPYIERNDIPVQLDLPAGTREHITSSRLEYIEESILRVNQELKESHEGRDIVKTIIRRIGPGSHQGQISAVLIGSEERNLNSADIAALVREEVGEMSDANKLTFGSSSAFGKPVSITILSDDQADLDIVRREVKALMKTFPELKDVVETMQEGRREINLKLKDRAYLLGLNEAQILSQVRQGYFGFEVQRLQRGKDEVKVWVRYNDQQRSSINELQDIRIRTANGKMIPLRELADFSITRGVASIDHLDGRKQSTIEAELSSKKISAPDVISQLREEYMDSLLIAYSGITALYEGQNREAAKTQKSSKSALPIVLIGILAMITFTFRSLGQAVIILVLLVPFSFIGVVWGHFLHGQQMSILSFLGVVALIGIIVNDSLVLVSKMNINLKEGSTFEEAVYRAGYSRFRAIFLTTLTTVAGLAPLILEKSFQAQFLIPMAISVAYGIAMATFLTLILLPVFLSLWNDLRRGFLGMWTGRKHSAEEIESAVIELKAEEYDS